MLTEYTTPGESVEVRDDESIYSLDRKSVV